VGRLAPAGSGRIPDLLKLRLGGLRRRAAATVIAIVALVIAVASTISWGIATASSDKTRGKTISDQQMTAIVAAAGSCPMLTPERLAGQLMAESGLDNGATKTTSGGQGIAGLRGDQWHKWQPYPSAARRDSAANIFALAHQMCDYSGRLRLVNLTSNQWELALAAFKTGLTNVQEAGGVPTSAKSYVDKARTYAAYYAKQEQFGGDGETEPSSAPSEAPTSIELQPIPSAKSLPSEYVQPVLAGGRVCKQVSPAAVAAVLMASSGFDADSQGDEDARGIARFRPDVWQSYGPKNGSPLDPASAIPAVGSALCGLMTDLSDVDGDPYTVALIAYLHGPAAVRQAGEEATDGGAAMNFVAKVTAYTKSYAADPQLTSPADEPGPSTSAGPTPPSTEPGDNDENTDKPKETAGVPFQQKGSGNCIDAGAGTDGTRLAMRSCNDTAGQRWDVREDGTIRSALGGLCVDVAWGRTDQGTPVQLVTCNGSTAQQWTISDDMLKSGLANNCVDSVGNSGTSGTELEMVACQAPGHDEQTWQQKS
jgi:ricin-type beta-trefoil lectin protein